MFWVLTAEWSIRPRASASRKHCPGKGTHFGGEDLVGSIWDDRPALPMNPVWILEEKYAGKSAEERLQICEGDEKRQATVHLLTSLDDIAWLLNIRGDDIVHTPVVLSYLIVTKQELFLFIHEKTLNEEVRAYLHGLGVRIMPYEAVYQIASAFRYERVLLEKSKINYRLFRCLDASVKVIEAMNPTAAAKAVKIQWNRKICAVCMCRTVWY